MSLLTQCLNGTLNADANIRIQAELTLSQLFLSPAGVILGKYISERWSPIFASWKGTSAPPEAKEQVRAIIFRGLTDPNRKIRTTSAFAISKIAHSDWPDHYPSLLENLITLLNSSSPSAIHGALQVFTEFAKDDLTEDQLLPVLRQLLPILISILGQAEQHSAFTRARAVAVFRQCVTSLLMVKDQFPEAIQEASIHVLPQWLEAFKVLLGVDPSQDLKEPSDWSSLAIRLQIFRTLNEIHAIAPGAITPYLPTFLSLGLRHLDTLLPTFRHYHVARDGGSPPPVTTADDPDQEVSLPHIASNILDFFSQTVSTGRSKEWFFENNESALGAVVQAVAGWTQMTEDDEDTWNSNANAFVAEEDDDSAVMSLRIAGFDLVQNLLESLAAPTTRRLQAITQKLVEESGLARQGGDIDWWKPLEAILAVLGTEAPALVQCIEEEEGKGRPKPFEVESLLTNVIPSLLSVSECPFLQGRALVFASNFARFLPSSLVGQYLHATVEVLESPATGIPVKVSAVKAIRNFLRVIDHMEFKAYAPRILNDLGPFLSSTSEDSLILVLETLIVVVKIDLGTWLSPEITASLAAAMLDAWRRNSKDPLILSVVTDVVSALAASPAPGIFSTLVTEMLPPLTAALNAATVNPQESWIGSSAFEILASLLKGGEKGKLGDAFVARTAPALFDCLAATEDRDSIIHATECITLIVRKGCDQLLTWTDKNGQPGLIVVLSFVARLLSTSDNESSGLFVGDLLIHLLRNTGEAIFPVLQDLLKALLTRLASAKTGTFIQGLVIPFAYLIQTQRDTVLALLESIDISAGESKNGLEVLIRAWCDNAEGFIGFWPSRVSTLALCELFVSNNANLRQLIVNGEQIIKPETMNVVMTRSRTRNNPTEYERIPFPVKALKLILHELQASVPPVEETKAENAESDDGDEAWDDDEVFMGLKKEEYGFLSEYLDEDAYDKNIEEDEDLQQDPISQIDMRDRLLTFLRHCATSDPNGFAKIASGLTQDEGAVVQQIVTN